MVKPPQVWDRPEYPRSVVTAFQAMNRGEAEPHQQTLALQYLIEVLCEAYNLSYRQQPYDTAFAEGRRFVGLQLVRLTKLKLEALKEKDDGRKRADHRRDPDRSPATEYGASPGSIPGTSSSAGGTTG